MLLATILSFLIAAIFGFLILIFILSDRSVPKHFVIPHAIFIILGLIILISYMVINKSMSPIMSLVLLIMAASASFRMLSVGLRKKTIPKWLPILHFMAEIVSIILLVIVLNIKSMHH